MSVYADVDFIMATICEMLLIVGIDIYVMFDYRNKWIKKDGLIKKFPSWNGTNKPKHWWILWNTLKLVVDVGCVLTYIFLIVREYALVMIALAVAVYVGLTIVEMLFYVIVEKIIVGVMRRKSKIECKTNNEIVDGEEVDT